MRKQYIDEYELITSAQIWYHYLVCLPQYFIAVLLITSQKYIYFYFTYI